LPKVALFIFCKKTHQMHVSAQDRTGDLARVKSCGDRYTTETSACSKPFADFPSIKLLKLTENSFN
jgi:hypothetical protein